MVACYYMDTLLSRIIPVSKARNNLADLTDSVQKNDYVVLTRGGVPKAALVDIGYFTKLQSAVRKMYQKTFMDPKPMPFTRLFSQSEIDAWEEEDRL